MDWEVGRGRAGKVEESGHHHNNTSNHLIPDVLHTVPMLLTAGCIASSLPSVLLMISGSVVTGSWIYSRP